MLKTNDCKLVISPDYLSMKNAFFSLKLTVALILLLLIGLLLNFGGILSEEYEVSIITGLISILVTVSLVDIFYSIENRRVDFKREDEKIINAHNLIAVYIDQYVVNAQLLFVPLGDDLDQEKEPVFNELLYLFQVNERRWVPRQVKKYELYFQTQAKLVGVLQTVVSTLNNETHPRIVKSLQGILRDSDAYFLLEAFQEVDISFSGNTPAERRPAKEFDLELIQNYKEVDESGMPKIHRDSNTLDIYILLFRVIKLNFDRIRAYNSEIAQVQKRLGR